MVVRSAELETVCGITSRFPVTGRCELAFSGKSNVGKSSLINTLLNRKKLARTSSQPGKTQTVNYYNINGQFYFVDLPGYGYAKVSVAVKEKWGKMVERYLDTSKDLKAVFLLIDIRHEPSKNDIRMYRWIVSKGYAPVIIATKADKIKRSMLPRQVKMIRTVLGLAGKDLLIPFSSETRQGKEEVWTVIENLISTGSAIDAESPTDEKNGIDTQQETGIEKEIDTESRNAAEKQINLENQPL